MELKFWPLARFAMRYFKFFIISLLSIGILFASGCRKKNKNEPVEISLNVYMVASESANLQGKSIGCGEVLVPVSKTILVEKNEVESAMIELFWMKDTDQLKNYIKGPGLVLAQANVSNGIAEVFINGDFYMTDTCYINRIRMQLKETAQQFKDVKEVKIFMNAQPLERYLQVAEDGFKRFH